MANTRLKEFYAIGKRRGRGNGNGSCRCVPFSFPLMLRGQGLASLEAAAPPMLACPVLRDVGSQMGKTGNLWGNSMGEGSSRSLPHQRGAQEQRLPEGPMCPGTQRPKGNVPECGPSERPMHGRRSLHLPQIAQRQGSSVVTAINGIGAGNNRLANGEGEWPDS